MIDSGPKSKLVPCPEPGKTGVRRQFPRAPRGYLATGILFIALGGLGAAFSRSAPDRSAVPLTPLSRPAGRLASQPGQPLGVQAAAQPRADNAAAPDVPARFPLVIRKPSGPPRITTGLHGLNGDPVTAACSTCHATRPPNLENRTGGDLDEFHTGLTIAHGNVSCLACHNSGDYDTLKLADGRRVEFAEVMTLCGQCHGPQMEAYEHGAHGGMTGYWDRRRGPLSKNNCIDCHPPHAPQFPKMRPTFKPRDRFLAPPRTEH